MLQKEGGREGGGGKSRRKTEFFQKGTSNRKEEEGNGWELGEFFHCERSRVLWGKEEEGAKGRSLVGSSHGKSARLILPLKQNFCASKKKEPTLPISLI